MRNRQKEVPSLRGKIGFSPLSRDELNRRPTYKNMSFLEKLMQPTSPGSGCVGCVIWVLFFLLSRPCSKGSHYDYGHKWWKIEILPQFQMTRWLTSWNCSEYYHWPLIHAWVANSRPNSLTWPKPEQLILHSVGFGFSLNGFSFHFSLLTSYPIEAD